VSKHATGDNIKSKTL